MTNPVSMTGRVSGSFHFRTQALTSLWLIERVDGQSEYYTDWDEDLSFPSVELGGPVSFMAAAGVDRSAGSKEVGFRSENMSVSGFIGGLSLSELKQGRYDMAKVTRWIVDGRWPYLPPLQKHVYWITRVSYDGETWVFEIEGPARRLKESYGNQFNRNCRWTLGQGGCGQDRSGLANPNTGAHIQIGTYTYGSTTPLSVAQVVSGDEKRSFNITRASGTPNAPLGRPYKNGRVRWVTGDNAGLIYEIRSYYDAWGPATINETGLFTTAVEMGAAVQVGDTCIVEEGCEQTPEMCKSTYNNKDNYGGFDQVPGPTRANQPTRVSWK